MHAIENVRTQTVSTYVLWVSSQSWKTKWLNSLCKKYSILLYFYKKKRNRLEKAWTFISWNTRPINTQIFPENRYSARVCQLVHYFIPIQYMYCNWYHARTLGIDKWPASIPLCGPTFAPMIVQSYSIYSHKILRRMGASWKWRRREWVRAAGWPFARELLAFSAASRRFALRGLPWNDLASGNSSTLSLLAARSISGHIHITSELFCLVVNMHNRRKDEHERQAEKFRVTETDKERYRENERLIERWRVWEKEREREKENWLVKHSMPSSSSWVTRCLTSSSTASRDAESQTECLEWNNFMTEYFASQ